MWQCNKWFAMSVPLTPSRATTLGHILIFFGCTRHGNTRGAPTSSLTTSMDTRMHVQPFVEPTLFATCVLEGLVGLHDNGILWRDPRPANVFCGNFLQAM